MGSDFTIITTDVNELVAELHDRMPVIIASRGPGTMAEGTTP